MILNIKFGLAQENRMFILLKKIFKAKRLKNLYILESFHLMLFVLGIK